MDGRYRKIGNGNNSVDESLFGSGPRKTTAAKNIRGVETGSVASTATLQKIVVTHSELERIRREAASGLSFASHNDQSSSIDASKGGNKVAEDRKEKMRELERKSQLLLKKAEMDAKRVSDGGDDNASGISAGKAAVGSDVVKMLSSMSMRASALNIRDKQLNEKKEKEQIEDNYERRMDMLMELDRMKDLKSRQQEEDSRLARRLADSAIITKQINDREKVKVLAMEAKEQENLMMRNIANKYSEEDNIKALARQREIERTRKEVREANEEQTRRRKQQKEQEKKDTEYIAMCRAAEEARLAERESEEAATAKIKRDRLARVAADNEKSSSKAGKTDEVRARRAAEDTERKERQREKEELIKRKAETLDLVNSRKQQALEKINRSAEAKKREQEEDLLALKHLSNISVREEEERAKRNQMSSQYKTVLLNQMNEAEARKKNQRVNSTDEGALYRQETAREEARLCALRDQMIKDLQDEGINNRYLAEIKAVDIGKLLRK